MIAAFICLGALLPCAVGIGLAEWKIRKPSRLRGCKP